MFATDQWRQALAVVCAAHAGLGLASLVRHHENTLYFETDTAYGFRAWGTR